MQLLPENLPEQFTTADMARAAEIPRWLAQKMAYCLRRMEAITLSGKRRNALLYSRPQGKRSAA